MQISTMIKESLSYKLHYCDPIKSKIKDKKKKITNLCPSWKFMDIVLKKIIGQRRNHKGYQEILTTLMTMKALTIEIYGTQLNHYLERNVEFYVYIRKEENLKTNNLNV